MIVLGVDPGARSTGLALVESFNGRVTRLLTHATVERAPGGVVLPPSGVYTSDVLAAVAAMAFFSGLAGAPADVIGVEGVNRPSWHMGGRAAANPEPLLATAWIAGLVQGAYPDLVRTVTPGGNGGGVLGSYPEELVSSRERLRDNWAQKVGGDAAKLRHARSAYDVARVASQMWKVRP